MDTLEEDIRVYRDIQRSLMAADDRLKDLSLAYALDAKTVTFLREVNHDAIRNIDEILWDAGVIN